MARPRGQDFQNIRADFLEISGHFGNFGNGNFGNFGNPESEGIPKFPKSPPLCFGKSCPLGRAILQILEIRKVRVKIFGNLGFCSLRLK